LWAELADRRRLLRETAPLPDHSPATMAMAHLPRPDPFLLFAGYPSGLLEPDMVVSLMPGATPQQVEACHKAPLADFAMAVLPALADMIAVVRRLTADGAMPAGKLAEAVAPGRSDRLYGGLVWMAKMDLVRIVPPAEPTRDAMPSR
jgi:hypothetical protein